MKIERKAVIRRRIRNIKADIQAVRNSGDTYRMRILYAQLTAATIKLHNMTHYQASHLAILTVIFCPFLVATCIYL